MGEEAQQLSSYSGEGRNHQPGKQDLVHVVSVENLWAGDGGRVVLLFFLLPVNGLGGGRSSFLLFSRIDDAE